MRVSYESSPRVVGTDGPSASTALGLEDCPRGQSFHRQLIAGFGRIKCMAGDPLALYLHVYYNIVWDRAKSERLKKERGLSFEEIVQEPLIAVTAHPSRANQWFLLFEREDYVWAVPFVARGDELFLKTLYPSRKYTKLWKQGEFD